MSKHEKETENPDEAVNLVEKIVDFNKQNQEGQGIKILTPDPQQINNLFSTIKSSK